LTLRNDTDVVGSGRPISFRQVESQDKPVQPVLVGTGPAAPARPPLKMISKGRNALALVNGADRIRPLTCVSPGDGRIEQVRHRVPALQVSEGDVGLEFDIGIIELDKTSTYDPMPEPEGEARALR